MRGFSLRKLFLPTMCCAVAFIGLAAGQVSETPFRRFGYIGESLSERELTQIAGLANAAGKPAWLVLGFASMDGGIIPLTVYLHPDATTERLRRGRILRLVTETPPLGATERRADWRVKETETYAYVPLAGLHREITDERDMAWPFAVDGDIDDDTLISLVTFVRSKPRLPGVREGQARTEVPSAPISGVWRLTDHFYVGLRLQGDSETFGVAVIKKDAQWVITKWNWAIA
jgi:hypothetical protein